MSAPMLWMVIPLLAAGVGWLLRRWPRIMQAFLTAVSFLLALLAWQLRIDAFTVVGPWTVKIESTLTVLGRNFSLLDSERGLLVFGFLFVGFWMVGLRMAACRPAAGPAALSMAALLIAARSVEPFLFSALLVELAVLASIPALIEPGQPVPQGVLRYLIFQTLAVPFILLAGWAATEAEVDPTNRQLLVVDVGSVFLVGSLPFLHLGADAVLPGQPLFRRADPHFAAGHGFVPLPGFL
jgi:NADH-quinone oxidoreductase subunit N